MKTMKTLSLMPDTKKLGLWMIDGLITIAIVRTVTDLYGLSKLIHQRRKLAVRRGEREDKTRAA